MQFGIWTPSRVDIWPIIARGEQLGFTHAFLYDSQMIYADVYSCLTLCAEHTTKIKLGHGVSNSRSRIPPLTASALGTINQLAPGRAFLGIGTGNSTRQAMGFPRDSLKHFGEYIRTVKALTRGELVEYTEGKRTQLIQMIHREGSIDGTFMNFRDPIPVFVAASGPKTRALAGEIGDGLIMGGRPTADTIAQVRKDMQVGADKVGRNANDIPIHLMTRLYILEPGETIDSPRAKRVTAPIASAIGNYATGHRPGSPADGEKISDDAIPPHMRPIVEGYRKLKANVKGPQSLDGPAWYATAYEGHGWKLQPELLQYVTEEAMRETALIGTADEILRQVKEWESMGIASVGPMCWNSVEDVSVLVERFGREIIQRY